MHKNLVSIGSEVRWDSNGRWLPGTTGNAAGRGMTNRQRISEKLLADLAEVWEAHGESVLQRLAISDPGKLATIAYGLLPRDLMISVEAKTPGNLEPAEWGGAGRAGTAHQGKRT